MDTIFKKVRNTVYSIMDSLEYRYIRVAIYLITIFVFLGLLPFSEEIILVLTFLAFFLTLFIFVRNMLCSILDTEIRLLRESFREQVSTKLVFLELLITLFNELRYIKFILKSFTSKTVLPSYVKSSYMSPNTYNFVGYIQRNYMYLDAVLFFNDIAINLFLKNKTLQLSPYFHRHPVLVKCGSNLKKYEQFFPNYEFLNARALLCLNKRVTTLHLLFCLNELLSGQMHNLHSSTNLVFNTLKTKFVEEYFILNFVTRL